jgi:hypothetical protein
MRWFSVRNANIPSDMRDAFDQAGTSVLQQLMFSGSINPANLPPILQRVGHQSAEREAAFKWLTEMADRAYLRESWSLTMETAITVLVAWSLFK